MTLPADTPRFATRSTAQGENNRNQQKSLVDHIRAVQLGAVLAREGHIGQDVMLAGVHQVGELGPARAQLLGDLAPGLAGMGAIGLIEGLADRGRDDGVLAARDMGQRVAHPVNATPLPCRLEDTGDGGLEAGVGIADHQSDTAKAAGAQRAKELGPERLGLGRADAQTDDFPAPLGVGGHGDYGRDWHDAPALAHLQIGGIQPDIGPFAGQRTVQELADPLVDVLAQLRHRALRDPAQPHGLHQLVHAAGRDAADPRFLDHGHQRLLGGLAGLEEAREVAALPQLRHPQVESAKAGVERPVTVAVTPGRAFAAALMPTGTDQAVDIGLHDQLKDGLGDAAKQITLIVLGHKLGQVHVGLGHPLAGRALRSNAPRGGVSVWSMVEVAKLHLDHTPRWPPGITPLTA